MRIVVRPLQTVSLIVREVDAAKTALNGTRLCRWVYVSDLPGSSGGICAPKAFNKVAVVLNQTAWLLAPSFTFTSWVCGVQLATVSRSPVRALYRSYGVGPTRVRSSRRYNRTIA